MATSPGAEGDSIAVGACRGPRTDDSATGRLKLKLAIQGVSSLFEACCARWIRELNPGFRGGGTGRSPPSDHHGMHPTYFGCDPKSSLRRCDFILYKVKEVGSVLVPPVEGFPAKHRWCFSIRRDNPWVVLKSRSRRRVRQRYDDEVVRRRRRKAPGRSPARRPIGAARHHMAILMPFMAFYGLFISPSIFSLSRESGFDAETWLQVRPGWELSLHAMRERCFRS